MGHHKKKNKKHKSKHRKRSNSDSDSPAESPKKQKIIGPILPTYVTTAPTAAPVPTTSSSQNNSYGPQLPLHLTKPKDVEIPPTPEQEEDHGEVIGPLPPGLENVSSSQRALEERAEILKYSFLLQNAEKDDETPQRESWMTDLPPEKANAFGLGPRKFRTAAITGDPKNRALWTETPLDKNKPAEIVEEDTNIFEDMVVSQRNKVMDDIVKKTKQEKQTKSLLELHQEKLKKKKKDKKDDKQERRPFDRDTDLQVNRFDEAQKKSILKKAQLLDTRFKHGKSKYL